MSDLYQEILVKRNTPVSDQIKKFGLIALTVFCFLGGLTIQPWFLVAGLGMAVVCYFVVPRFDLEYEYLYVNGELDIDKIMNKQKRKRCASYNIDQLEILAPSNSGELDRFRKKQDIKIKDYTSLDPQVPSYTLVFNQDKGQELLKLELNQAVVNDIRRIAPRKVVKD